MLAMAARPPRYFLSHSMSDDAAVKMVRDQAAALGVDVYLAEHDLRPGTSLTDKLLGEIRKSDGVVALLTEDAVSSAYVQHEIGAAITAGKLVVPIVQAGIRVEGMLAGLERVEVDFGDPASAATVADALAAVVRRQLQAAAAADRERALILLGAMALLIVLAMNGK